MNFLPRMHISPGIYNQGSCKNVLGKDITEKLLRGCSVHWKRSVNKVAKLVFVKGRRDDI